MARFYFYIGISLLFLSISMTFTSMYIIEDRIQVVNQLATNIEKQASSASAIFIEREQQNKLQLEYFSGLRMMQKALLNQDYQPLDDLFFQLMNKKPSVVQVRLLNLQGEELYRIDNKMSAPTLIPTSSLQNKSSRYYIKELLALPSDQTYMSQIDLNVEHGVIETPHRPVLRIAKKIVEKKNGREIGALMINFDLNRLFKSVSASIPEQMNWYFIDESGQFLATPTVNALFCAQLDCDVFQERQTYNPMEKNYYNGQLAAVIDINSDAGIKSTVLQGSDLQLILNYKTGFMTHFTTQESEVEVLINSRLWWVVLLITTAILVLSCMLYEHYQQKITDRINKGKMQSVLEGVTEMLERLHESDDPVTGSHVHRVAAYSRLLAEHLQLDKQLVKDIYQYSSLHDIGKISTPDRILSKPGKLDADEWFIMKQHVDNGYQLLHEFDFSPVAENIVRSHHERWDGNGYPRQISGEEIPIEARIVSLVDCFDALMSERPYKEAFSFEKSKKIINDLKGKAFDPKLVDLFNQLEKEFKAMRSTIKS